MNKTAKKALVLFLAIITISMSMAPLSPVHGVALAATAEQVQTLNVSYYTIPSGGQPLQIVSGPDGNLWFTIDRTGMRSTYQGVVQAPVIGSIGRITPDGTVTEFTLPSVTYDYIEQYPGSDSFSITAGPDGNLWFTQSEANKIGKITPQGVITEYTLPYTEKQPRSITTGPDGNVWIIGSGTNGNIVFSMNTEGVIVKEFPIPGYNRADSIVIGPDGNLWLRGEDYYSLGRITPNGVYTSFPTSGSPVDIIAGVNNDLWIGLNGGHISRVTTDGIITSYQNTPGELAWTLTMDSDDNIWFKDSLTNKINKMGSNGENRTTFSLSDPSTYIYAGDTVFGSDGNIWFTNNGRIGRIEVVVPTPTVEPTATPTPEPTAIPTPTVVVDPTPTVTPMPTETITPTPTAVVDPTPTTTPEPTCTPTPTVTTAPESIPEPTPTNTPTPTIAVPTPTEAPNNSTSVVSTENKNNLNTVSPAPTPVKIKEAKKVVKKTNIEQPKVTPVVSDTSKESQSASVIESLGDLLKKMLNMVANTAQNLKLQFSQFFGLTT